MFATVAVASERANVWNPGGGGKELVNLATWSGKPM
jgi:hypothetical protein